MATRGRLTRLFMALALLAACRGGPLGAVRMARAAAPSITVMPGSVVPHGAIHVTGSGFDPSTGGHQVLVDIAVVNSAGATPIGALPTDAQGNLTMSGGQGLTLPFTIDVTGANQITAAEEGNTGLGASMLVTGTLLQPMLNGGQGLSAHPGDQLDAKGTGFAPGDVLSVSLDGTQLSGGTGGNTITADASGSADILLTVPQAIQPGTHTLTVTGKGAGAGQHDTASLTLSVAPGAATGSGPGNVQITPNPVAVGTAFQARAVGFQPNEQVTFTLKYFDRGINSYAVQNTPAQADASGAVVASVMVPASADGSKPATLTVLGLTSGVTASAPITFAQLAQIAFTPTTALAGAQVTVNGSGFVPNERLFTTTRLFPPTAGLQVVDATGHFSATVTLARTLAPGSYVLAVSGSGGDNGNTNFTVAAPVPPALTISPTTAPAGGMVTVSGAGFGPQESVQFSINGISLGATAPLSGTDALGVFTATVTLAGGLPPSSYRLLAKGAVSGISQSAAIAVTGPDNKHWYFAEGFTGQGPKVFFHETITVLNANTAPAHGILTYQFPDGSTEALPVSIKGRSERVEDVNADVGSNRIVSAVLATDQPVVAERTIVRTDRAKHVLDSDFSPGENAPQATWYFAEGYSGVTFQPYLTVMNPGAAPISMTVTLYPSSGTPRVVSAALQPFGRYTLNLRAALPNRSFSMRLDASGPVVAERVEYWGDGVGSAKFGAGVKPGVSIPMPTWYFGYGAILGGDQAFLSVLNPNSKPVRVTANYINGTGIPAGHTTITVGPGVRATLTLNKLLGKSPHSPIAAIVSAALPIVAEEAQYHGGSPNVGQHAGASIEGRTSTSTRWSFASGDTRSFAEDEYALNPSSKSTTLTVTFYGVDGQVISASYLLKPRRVISISANAVPGLHRGVHGSIWRSNGNVGVVLVQTLQSPDGRAFRADQGIPG